MIVVEQESNKELNRILKEMPTKGKATLRKAVNETATKARDMLADTAREEYTVKKSNFKKDMKINKARGNNLVAVIKTQGRPLSQIDFKVTRATYNPSNRPKVHKGKILQSNSLKELRSGSVKAFVVKFKSGHVDIAQRVPGTHMQSNPKKEKIETRYSPSIPQMIGSEYHVLRHNKPLIENMLKEYLRKHIATVTGGGR